MGLESWFGRRNPARESGAALYGAAVRQARLPDFYLALGAPDTPEGRFELYSLHVALLLRRLRLEGAAANEVAQSLFDAFVQSLDDALREMGVSDVRVGKRMRKLGQSLYGRLQGYEAAFGALPDQSELAALVDRTIFAGEGGATAALCRYAILADEQLRSQPMEALVAGNIRWPVVQS